MNGYEPIPQEPSNMNGGGGHGSAPVENMYQDWFLDYASYVILDRAVPNVEDGLKPVQRRILHAMFELEDGRYNKAANIIGHTMRYHPHGDMAIEDALVKIAQKDFLIDTQGNWGNLLTGDRAAAPRYIEARLSPFAKEILFNEKTTEWQASYDGRNREPVALPVKFPLLLALGVEGIAVGLSTRILPHNPAELIDASINVLRNRDFEIFPDFQSAGAADFSQYKEGMRGGKVKIRAKIEVVDQKTLKITELPFATTTSSLIDSIIAANDKGKIKIKKVEDNTSHQVEITICLPTGVSPLVTIDALYAFTDCELSISPNCCVIVEDKPVFCSVNDLLKQSALKTKEILGQELQIKLTELQNKLHFASLELLFIEKKIYRKIEGAESWEQVLATIEKGLQAYASEFIRELTTDDIVKLTEIKIKRISKFDRDRADEAILKLKDQIAEIEQNLSQLTKYTINYYKQLKKTYGKNWSRKTTISSFEQVEAKQVAVANLKLYVNRKDGFIGTGLKKDEFVTECSELDELIVVCKDGKFVVTKVSDKSFVGKGIIHVAVFQRGDEKRIYHMIYQDGRAGAILAKRFPITSITRDREYDLTKAAKGGRIIHFSVNPQGENEVVELTLKAPKRGQAPYLHLDFSDLPIQTRNVKGQLISKEPIDKVEIIEREAPKLEEVELWFDKEQRRLNTDQRGQALGSFSGDDQICVLYRDGSVELTGYSLDTYFDKDILHLGKFRPDTVLTCVYYHGEKKDYYVKRFSLDELSTGKREEFISSEPGSRMLILSFHAEPVVEVTCKKGRSATAAKEVVELAEMATIRSLKAMGNKLSRHTVQTVKLLKSQAKG
ncbi:MAG: DNA gyrase/topoisomerase IV subunit A [Oligoflexus sp.]